MIATLQVKLVLASSRAKDGWYIYTFIILPYFVLIHLGIIIFFSTLVVNLIKRRHSISLTPVKLYAALYGAGVGVLLPYFERVYGAIDAPSLAILADLPALVIANYIATWLHLSSSKWSEEWLIYIPYYLFGLAGGWGLGQAIEWVLRGRKEAKGRHQTTGR